MRVKRVCLLLLLLGASPPVLAQHEPGRWFSTPLSERIASYQIRAELNPEEKLVRGSELLIWRNRTHRPVRALQFHLYMNAFRNSESTFMREVSYRSRYAKRPREDWGWIEVDTLEWRGRDLLPGARFIHPDDDNEQDRTVLEVPLPRPVGPGEAIRVRIAFRTKLPRIIARTGFYGDDFFFVAQWFPKIGVLEEDGWNCHQFHRNSEFYADFGVYDVTLILPADWVVGATGSLVEKEDVGDSLQIVRYHAEDVHDFAWTASPNYLVFTDSLGGTEIRALVLREHAPLGRRHLEAAKAVMKRYREWFGHYPYPVLTVVDTKGRAAGMEYPTLITAGVLFGPWLPARLRILENVIVHEFGHQYWYGMVANNEFEEAWLDEGINSYCETRFFAKEYGAEGNVVDLLGLRLSDLEAHRMRVQSVRSPDPVRRNAWEFVDPTSYSVNSYSKVALALTTLERLVGEEEWLAVMRRYFERWRFRHPHSEDFLRTVDEQLHNPAYTRFLRQILETPGHLDYAVERVATYREKSPVGVDFDSLAAPGADTTLAATADTASEDTTWYWSEVLLRRYGKFQLPVEAQLLFENGDTVQVMWDGVESWRRIRVRRPARLLAAEIDPHNKVPMDLDRLNNSRTVEPRTRGIWKLVARWTYWVQALMALFSFFS